MMKRRAHLGDTFSIRHGSRRGIQVRDRHGGVGPVVTRTSWSGTDLGRGGKVYQKKNEFDVEREWKAKGYSLDKPEKSPVWGAIVARQALQMAAWEAPAKRAYFEGLKREAAVKYSGTPVPATLKIVLTQVDRAAPKARAWLMERAKRFAAAFEGYDPVRKITPLKLPATEDQSEEAPDEGLLEKIKPYAGWIAGGAAALLALAFLFRPRREVVHA